MTFFKSFICAAITALTMAPAITHAQAAADQNIAAQETPWQVTCAATGAEGALDCSASKSLVVADTNQALAQIFVINGDPAVMQILLPHGLSLAEGLSLAVDGADLAPAPFVTSQAGGVVAALDLTPEVEGKLRFGQRLAINAVRSGGGALQLEIGLSGFAASMAKLR